MTMMAASEWPVAFVAVAGFVLLGFILWIGLR